MTLAGPFKARIRAGDAVAPRSDGRIQSSLRDGISVWPRLRALKGPPTFVEPLRGPHFGRSGDKLTLMGRESWVKDDTARAALQR